MQIEVPSDDGGGCLPTGGPAYLSTEVQNANGVTYEVEATVPDGNDYLQVGEVVEVSVDYDTVVAALKSNEKEAVTLAKALGMRSSEKGAVSANAKLTDAEYDKLATHIQKAAYQSGRATGRSNPAPDAFTRRVDAVAQAFGRAMDSIGRNLPSFNAFLSVRTYYPNGQMRSETTMGAEVKKK